MNVEINFYSIRLQSKLFKFNLIQEIQFRILTQKLEVQIMFQFFFYHRQSFYILYYSLYYYL